MPTPTDTSAEAEAVLLQLLREKTPAERGSMALRLSADVARASKLAIQRAHPEFNAIEVGQMFVELHYGTDIAAGLRQYQGSTDHG